MARNSKVKIAKYLEEQEQKPEAITGTFGPGADTFNFKSTCEVDKACDLNKVAVLQDYSCTLTLEDINYNQVS
jgi:hypothetical protein